MTRSSLKRDSNDRIKIFDRDEWLLKRQRERTTKLLDLEPEFQKAKEKISDPTVSANKNHTTVVDRSVSTYTTRCNSTIDTHEDATVNSNTNCSKPVDITSTKCKVASSNPGEVRIQQMSLRN